MINTNTVRKTSQAAYGQSCWTPPGTLFLAALQEPETTQFGARYNGAIGWQGERAEAVVNTPEYKGIMDAAVEVSMVHFKMSEDEARAALADGTIRPPIRPGDNGDLNLFAALKVKKDKAGNVTTKPVPCMIKGADGTVRLPQDQVSEKIERFSICTLRVEVYASDFKAKQVNTNLVAVVRLGDPLPYEGKSNEVSDDDLAASPSYEPTANADALTQEDVDAIYGGRS